MEDGPDDGSVMGLDGGDEIELGKLLLSGLLLGLVDEFGEREFDAIEEMKLGL